MGAAPAAVLLGLAIWLSWREDPRPAEPRGAQGPAPRVVESRSTAPPVTPSDMREESTTEEPDEPIDEPSSRPAVHHEPGQGPIPPVDLTNMAPEKLGKTPWFRLLKSQNEWQEMWDSIHADEPKRNDPIEEPPGPLPMIDGEEAVLVVGLGDRPRIDYAAIFQPVAPKFGEARYRLEIQTMAGPPVEVATRPVRVWFVPIAAMGKVGLVVENEKGLEIARFDVPEKVTSEK